MLQKTSSMKDKTSKFLIIFGFECLKREEFIHIYWVEKTGVVVKLSNLFPVGYFLVKL